MIGVLQTPALLFSISFMPNITPEIEAFARIKVVGVGGSGKNAVNHMINSKVKGVDFITVNTDAQELHHSLAKKRIHIGKNLTRGLGTGMNPEMGKRAVEETKEEVQETLEGRGHGLCCMRTRRRNRKRCKPCRCANIKRTRRSHRCCRYQALLF
jgi:hypothetical protein